MTAVLRRLAPSLLLLAPDLAVAEDLVAVSDTAMAITGDIVFDDFGITFANGEALVFDELVGDSFVVGSETVPASVYSVENPSDPILLNGNALCGAGDVTYLANWTGFDGTSSVIAVFTTPDVPESDADMCASYAYEYAE